MQGVQGGKQAPRRTSGAMAGTTKKHFTQEFPNYVVSFVFMPITKCPKNAFQIS